MSFWDCLFRIIIVCDPGFVNRINGLVLKERDREYREKVAVLLLNARLSALLHGTKPAVYGKIPALPGAAIHFEKKRYSLRLDGVRVVDGRELTPYQSYLAVTNALLKRAFYFVKDDWDCQAARYYARKVRVPFCQLGFPPEEIIRALKAEMPVS